METMVCVIVVPEAEWKKVLGTQEEIIKILREIKQSSVPVATAPYITAMEFMEAVRIKRTKFDQLVQMNKIKTIKKDRKIYVPFGEVERYFKSAG
jgi:ribosome-interacting GTPase 1